MSQPIWQLNTKIEGLSGVGPVVSTGLHKLGIATIDDLLHFYPRRWEDYTVARRIAELTPGLVSVRAQLLSISNRRSFRRKVTVTEAILGDGSGTLRAVWFNQPYLSGQLKTNDWYYFSGKFEFRNNFLSLQNPSFEPAPTNDKQNAKILPIYSENSQINSRLIRKLIDQVIDGGFELAEDLPNQVMQAQDFMSLTRTIVQLHQPTSMHDLQRARDRLAFTELFMMMCASLTMRQEFKAENAPMIPFDLATVNKLLKNLPFSLTAGQKKSAWAIFSDLAKSQPMNRLIEGDVGSGKTVVAGLAAAMAHHAGKQVAFMVPTEILARQHVQSLQKMLTTLGIRAELLVGSLPTKQKNELTQRIKTGTVDLIIGTHALLSEKIDFAHLGLVIVDEQHRFGVVQRKKLRQDGQNMPHLLSMTATPIPRSLALVIYGDLDISIIKELPPGRQKIITKLVEPDGRARVYGEIDEQISQGRQVFVVCPSIEHSDKSGRKSVKIEYERLSRGQFQHRRIGMLHGRMKSDEKETVMADFVSGKLDMVVATSVIEVGVDVPNATVMLIDGAEHFGLATLHQLRGRVGRGEHQSYCYLISDNDRIEVLNRLRALERTGDGFRLAQLDLELRGPGEVYGVRQHGIDLRMDNILDPELIEKARLAAEAFVKSGKMLKYPQVMTRIEQLKGVTSLD